MSTCFMITIAIQLEHIISQTDQTILWQKEKQHSTLAVFLYGAEIVLI